uniref:Centriolin-like n=1 Tax=Saccoglossus kowalevskii TaxID=10224 RepID=A0ABM0MUV3_SACKO|nr:PREDICTED: centriolin-like [Saccoglossus kowalevskii]
MNRSGGRLTPTQKYATRRESPILLPHAESDTSLNRRGILSPHSADNVKDGKAPRNLVRYITETLIKKLAKEESLDQILSLNLTLSKEGGKKIKYIENLELLRRLQVLSLSCNIIEKIEKLDKLTKLRELNLSFNCITKIEGLENLVHLQVLNLTGNQIEHIPTWLAKKLKELQTFRIAKNKLATLQEISRLRPLKDMVQLNVSDNPLCELPHSRLFIVFQLRTLEILDGQSVDIKERQAAQERFEQEEIENLADRLEKQEKKSRNLEEEKTKSLTEIKHKDERVDELKKKEKDSKRTIKELQKELETKDELLKRKTSELTKACQKHYRLEQELAFYKIDAKFESLGQFPQLSQSGDEGGLEESPYIGKARYKRSGTAGEKFLLNKAQPVTVQKLNYDEPDANPMNQQIKDRIHQALDNQLVDKEQNIGKAQERLLKLQDELHNTEQQILDATQELRRIAQATPQRPLTEEDKQQIRNRLAKKMRTVNTLRDRASEIEDEMGRTKHYMQREEKTIADLLIEMEKLGEDHPQYATNDSLKDRLRGQQKQIDEVLHNSIRPEDIVKRLHEMTVNLDDGDEITPYSDRDILGKTLSELQQQLKDKLKQSNKEKEQARKRQEKAEAEIKAMQNRLQSADEQYKQLTDKALQAKLSEQRKLHEDSLRRMQVDMKKLSDKIKEAEKRAAEEKEKAQKSPSPKKSDTPTPRKNPKDQERISQLEKDLSDIKKNTEIKRNSVQKKDSEAQAQIARLEGELRRRKAKDEEDKKKHEQERQREKERREKERRDKEKRTDEEKQKERKQKEREDRDRQKEKQREKEMKERDENMLIHPQARQAAKELLKAQDDIEKLMELLSEKERDLEIEIEEADKASSTVAAQQEEIDYLYDKLDEQKSEIRRLQEILDKFGGTLDADDDPEIAALMNEVDALKDALFEQSNRIVDISTPRGPSVRRVHYGNVVDEYQYSPPSSNWPPERNANFPHQHGPAYYPEDGGRYYSSPYAASPARYYPRSAGRGYGYANEPSSPTPPQGAAFAPVPGQAPLPAQPDFDASLTMPSGIPPGFAPVPPGYGTTNASYAAGVSTQPQVVLSGPPPATATTPSAASQPVIVTSTATSSGQTQQEILPRQIELPADMLFCNVPEHHDLEDEVTKLQKLLDKQSRRSEKKKKKPRGHPGSADSLLYDRLEDSLEVSKTMPMFILNFLILCRCTKPKTGGNSGSRTSPSNPSGNNSGQPNKSLRSNRGSSGGDQNEQPNNTSYSSRTNRNKDTPLFYIGGGNGVSLIEKPLLDKGWIRTRDKQTDDYKLKWVELRSSINYHRFREGDQLVNRIPNSSLLATKVGLVTSLREYERVMDRVKEGETWICKPTGLNQGKGIYLVQDITELKKKYGDPEEDGPGNPPPPAQQRRKRVAPMQRLIQRYVPNPLLLNGKKFDVRVYMLIACTNPLMVFYHKATYVQKKDPMYEEMKEETAWSMDKFNDYVNENLAEEKGLPENWIYGFFTKRMQAIMLNCTHAVRNKLQCKLGYFDLYGFDFLLDTDMKVWLLEINVNPALHVNCEALLECIPGVVSETLVSRWQERRSVVLPEQLLWPKPDRLHSDFREDRDTRQKIDTHHNELEDIDHEIGQRKADLQILQENIEKRKAELTHVLREGETDVAKKQRDIKKVQDILEELTVQNKDLEVTVSEKRSQLVKLRDCVDQEDETLQQLVSNVNKYKTELKHVLEMLQLEKTELEALKQHHTDKMIDLEKTQLAVIEEKSELERLQTEAQRKRTELERSKQIVEKEKADSERLVAERKSMQDHIDTLTKEKELLENNCSNLEGKICNLKK